jgi:hypothetical protein
MNKILHIVNGDSTARLLIDSGIEGDLVVWREVLCEGPLHSNIGSDAFWKIRYDFFEEAFKVDQLSYYDKTIKEILKVDAQDGITDHVLWFEYDLFCQVNLIGLCSFLLQRYRKDNRYFLVCPGTRGGKPLLLSTFEPDDVAQLFSERVKLTRKDLLFAEECWSTYVTGDASVIREFDFARNAKFNLLGPAMAQHLERFPDEHGLGQIERRLLQMLVERPRSRTQLVADLLRWQHEETVYGFGDLQFYWYIFRLQHYLTSDKNVLKLTPKATELF